MSLPSSSFSAAGLLVFGQTDPGTNSHCSWGIFQIKNSPWGKSFFQGDNSTRLALYSSRRRASLTEHSLMWEHNSIFFYN
jgi:hypothetical protein